MIYDRTQDDVNAAILIRDEKVKKFQSLTMNEIMTLERGTITIDTLNRIESKQAEIATTLKSWRYLFVDIFTKTWTTTEFFKQDDFLRITQNTIALQKCFSENIGTIQGVVPEYSWQALNAIEKLLYDIEEAINSAKRNFPRCGAFLSGQTRNLQLGAK